MSNWREVRAMRPPREDRVALHRAHLDEERNNLMAWDDVCVCGDGWDWHVSEDLGGCTVGDCECSRFAKNEDYT